MANDFFTASGSPATRSPLASATIRAEFALLASAFDKMPGLTGKALQLVRVNAGATGLESTDAIDDIVIGGVTPEAGTFTTLTATTLAGSGAGLTALDASNLASGTVPNARISGSYTGLANLTLSGHITLPGAGANIFTSVATSRLQISGGSSATLGARFVLDGESHASTPNRVSIYGGATAYGIFDSTGLTLSTGVFSGNGSSLTTLNASNLSSGTVPNARLSATLTSDTSGNAATATVLQTARTINGTSFNGSANITVTAAAGTLTGATLAAGVTASSLTSVGTLGSLTVSGTATAGAFSGPLTGNASTATTLQTARTINGTSFNGSANITVTAAAGTLTGATLAAGVTASSLTSVGTLGSLTVSGTLTGTTVGLGGATPTLNLLSTASGSSTIDDTIGSGVTLSSASMNVSSKFTSSVKFASTDPEFTTSSPKVFAAIAGEALQTYSSDTTGGMDLVFFAAPINPGAGPTGLMTEGFRVKSTGAAVTGALSVSGAASVGLASTVDGISIGYRSLPALANTATATAAAVGKCYLNTGNITINNSVFSAGDVFCVYNNSGSNITITDGTITTMRLGGTATTGSRTLAQRGMATLFFPTATECVVTGAGVS